MKKKIGLCGIVVFALLVFVCFPAYANAVLIERGATRILYSLAAIPVTIIEHSQYVVFPFGILTGTLAGTFRMLTGTIGGAAEIAQGAAPYAKYLLFI